MPTGNRDKLEFTVNEPITMTMVYDDPQTGASKWGKWFRWTVVVEDSTEEVSWFINSEHLAGILSTLQIGKDDTLTITMLQEEKADGKPFTYYKVEYKDAVNFTNDDTVKLPTESLEQALSDAEADVVSATFVPPSEDEPSLDMSTESTTEIITPIEKPQTPAIPTEFLKLTHLYALCVQESLAIQQAQMGYLCTGETIGAGAATLFIQATRMGLQDK